MAIRKQNIITAVLTRLATIKVSAGYNSDAGNSVDESRSTKYKETELPAININESGDTILEESNNNWHTRLLELDIEIIANGNLAADELRKVEADVFKCIGVDETWSGYAIQTLPGDVTTNYSEHEENKIIGKTITIGIQYRIIAWQNE